MLSFRHIICSGVLVATLQSCDNPAKWESEPVSTDTVELGKLINLNDFRPDSVRYQYSFIDNSGKNDRLPSVPGPSDHSLEAVLYFSDSTYNRLCQQNLKLSQTSTRHKEDYGFAWLNQQLKDELHALDASYNDTPPDFFTRGSFLNGGYLVLHNKILLRLGSQ